jgi:hypothetical protein
VTEDQRRPRAIRFVNVGARLTVGGVDVQNRAVDAARSRPSQALTKTAGGERVRTAVEADWW